MKTTSNYGLRKPEATDIVDIDDINCNSDIIDQQLAAREGLIKSASAKTTLVDADTIPLSDSAASSATKKITFANLKASLKTYFDTLYNKYTHPSYTAKASGLYKVTVDSTGHVSATTAVAKEDITALGIPGSNTTYSNMKGATSSAAGTAGLVPAPAAGKQASFLRGDGTWVVPTNTTYGNMTGATASAAGKAGLVPAPAAGAQGKYLRGDGTWQDPIGATATVAVSLTAASWAGTAAPYTYNVTVSGHSNTTDMVDLMMGDSMTAAQLTAAQAANIAKAEWTANTTLKLYAYGTKPTVDLPIKVHYHK